ncbi:uncharacterized protein [Euwallacea fornicatus]|uniref:uncharacterized protein n=1 Tax=Euwallacea fornicatus TaxID=995702 RepID=UPI00338E24ED
MKMTILHSCCCWNSVRKGSIACGVYTGIYYTLTAAQSSFLLHEEINYLKNASNNSLIDHDITSETVKVKNDYHTRHDGHVVWKSPRLEAMTSSKLPQSSLP